MSTANTTAHATSDPIHEYYQVKENCYTDLKLARDAFGSTLTTEDQYDAMEKGLGIMYLHCPEGVMDIVEATMWEASWRRPYFKFGIDI